MDGHSNRAAGNGTLKLHTPVLQRFYRDWDERRRGREFPARADFDPVDLAYVLGNVSLIEVFRDPLRFRYRVHASNTGGRLGMELTGKFLDESPDAQHRQLAGAHFAQVVNERRPVAYLRDHNGSGVLIWRCEVLVLPSATDGSHIDMLMSAVIWQ